MKVAGVQFGFTYDKNRTDVSFVVKQVTEKFRAKDRRLHCREDISNVVFR